MIDGLFLTENYILAKGGMYKSLEENQAIASNIANSLTPGYKRIQVNNSFATELNSLISQGKVKEASMLRPMTEVDPDAQALRDDGNTVSVETELLNLNKTLLQHEYSTLYLSSSYKQLREAISGKSL
ncbi:MAG: flagellar basal body rod protein FlgB [Verrucomicrobia bacterium CG_4_10_14_3_um_filter_43_23]|nr:MAG: flagellar basal body rod protein FlgB [Verrucomicrobia bacterium CG_4_10_14_3_um_filter_43_23]PIY62011.1 MAG: flagellar basal body rod protein FlgB [Verrucomicrobia bacterium CG_4_10_14_0_8_um_filter_43_34]